MTSPHINEGGAVEETSELDPRRKRARWRAWHRGTREVDLILGRFADREIGSISEEELTGFEALLERTESEVFAWVTGSDTPPGGIEGELVVRLREYRGEY